MAWGNSLLDKGYDASDAIGKFYAVKYTDTEEVGPVTTDTDVIAGFAQFAVTDAEILKGKGASVRKQGITEAVVGDGTNIAVGDEVQLMSDGRVQKANGSDGNRIVGVCVGSPSADEDDRIALEINTNGGLS